MNALTKDGQSLVSSTPVALWLSGAFETRHPVASKVKTMAEAVRNSRIAFLSLTKRRAVGCCSEHRKNAFGRRGRLSYLSPRHDRRFPCPDRRAAARRLPDCDAD